MYWGILFSEEMRGRLKAIYKRFFSDTFNEEEWVMYGHHVTLIHSSHKSWKSVSQVLQNFEGCRVDVHLVSIGISENVIAFGVDTNTMNKHSHITIACRKGHKPVESNDIKKWERLYTDVYITGMLKLMD